MISRLLRSNAFKAMSTLTIGSLVGYEFVKTKVTEQKSLPEMVIVPQANITVPQLPKIESKDKASLYLSLVDLQEIKEKYKNEIGPGNYTFRIEHSISARLDEKYGKFDKHQEWHPRFIKFLNDHPSIKTMLDEAAQYPITLNMFKACGPEFDDHPIYRDGRLEEHLQAIDVIFTHIEDAVRKQLLSDLNDHMRPTAFYVPYKSEDEVKKTGTSDCFNHFGFFGYHTVSPNYCRQDEVRCHELVDDIKGYRSPISPERN